MDERNHIQRGPLYTVGQVSKMSGASVRALHYYEDLGLLQPEHAQNGYRMYTPQDMERLQQVLLYRACGMELGDIKELLDNPDFDVRSALDDHLVRLTMRKKELEILMCTVRKTIESLERGGAMADEDRFEGLKQQVVEANESVYGVEARERYGDDAVDAANDKLLAMSMQEWSSMQELEAAIIEQLKTAMATGDTYGTEARRLAAMHAQWIRMRWADGAYSREAHLGLVQGYLADERFCEYYDSRAGKGATRFLVRAIRVHV